MRFSAIFALAASMALSACTSGGDGSASAAASLASTGSFGVVQVERQGSKGMPELSEPRAVLNAVFARYSGLEGQDALQLLGVAQRGPETDECALLGAKDPLYPGPDAQVELLDVGKIDVRVAGSDAQLTPRMFPELGSLVSGVFYAEDAELAQTRADVDEYHIVASGGARVAPFEVVGVGPPAPAGVVVGGFSAKDKPTVVRSRALEIVWDPGDPRDRIDLQLASGSQAIACVAHDDGLLQVPADLMAQLDPDTTARLVMKRVRVQPFDAPGIDVAWADLISTRTIDLVVH